MVSFVAFHLLGFGMPVHRFLREVLHHYGVSLHELSPNGIQQMAAFVALCGGFLGINPHFDLFFYFFKAALVKPSGGVAPWGFCSIQMKQSRMKQSRIAQYLRVELPLVYMLMFYYVNHMNENYKTLLFSFSKKSIYM